MLRVVHLHIGRAKTGTTAIQSHLKACRNTLAADGICYPSTGQPGNRPAQEEIALACIDAATDLDVLRRTFEEEVGKSDRIIVSSEGFQNITDTHRISRFFRRDEAFYSIETICCLREYLDTARSAYAQHVQASQLLCTFEEFCAHFSRLDLREFLDRWEGFSGKLHVINYDQAMASGGIVPAFFETANISKHYTPTTSANSNPSIAGNLLAFKLRLNSLVAHRNEFYAGLHRLALQSPRYRGPFRIGKEQAARLRAADNGYNKVFAKRCGEVVIHDFTGGQALLDADHWNEDIERFLADPAFEYVRDIPEIRDLPTAVTNGLLANAAA